MYVLVLLLASFGFMGCGEQALKRTTAMVESEVAQPIFESRVGSTTFDQTPIQQAQTETAPPPPVTISMKVRFIGSNMTSAETNGGVYSSTSMTVVLKNSAGETFSIQKDVRANLLNKKYLTLPKLKDGSYELQVLNTANKNILMIPNDNVLITGVVTIKDNQVIGTKEKGGSGLNGYSILYGTQDQCDLPVAGGGPIVEDGVVVDGTGGPAMPPPGCDQLESPLVVDLRSDAQASKGIKMSAPLSGVMFDIFGIGKQYKMAWLDASSMRNFGFIALPNADGSISGINNLFGDNTKGPDGNRAQHGFEALAKYDKNQDNVINSKDSIYTKLQVWTDTTRNGKADAGELKSLSSYGIKEIDLNYFLMNEVDQWGNQTLMRSEITMVGGAKRAMFDVWFRVLGGSSP